MKVVIDGIQYIPAPKPSAGLPRTDCSASGFCQTASDALLQLGGIQSAIREVFDLDETPITADEVRSVCERHAGSGIHSCHQNCQRIECVQRRELKRLIDAVRNLRDVQGRHNTQIAMERLFSLLPENSELSQREVE